MDNLRLDLRFAIRALRKSPGFALAAILTLALGIGANTAIFSVVHGVLLESLPFEDPGRLAIVWETDAHNESFRENASAPDYFDFKTQSTSFAGLAAYQPLGLSLTERDGEPRRVSAAAVSHDLFWVLGSGPALGRGFAREDDRIGGTPVTVLSHALWVERYGSDPGVLGRRVMLESLEHTIVGVMPPGLDFPDVELWIPLLPAIEPFVDVRGVHNLTVIGRLAEGRSLKEAGSEMATIAARLEAEYPEDNIGRGVQVESLHDAVVGRVRPALWILLAAVSLVLLIACVNVASLLLARASARAREVAVRSALGAARGRLVRQLLTESLVIGLAGGALGLLLAFWAVDALRALAPPGLPRLESVGLDGPVLLFALGVSLLSGLLFGIVPTWNATGRRLAETLQEGSGRAGTGRARRRARSALVVSEVALAVMLTIGAGLLIKSFWRLTHVDPGFDPEGVLVVQVTLPQSTYPVPDRSVYPAWPEVRQFFDRVTERLATVPGVVSVGIAANHPVQSGWTSQVGIVGRTEREGPRDEVRIRPATPGYFGTVGIPQVRGRALDERDRAGTPDVLLVNEAFVRRYFPGEDPIGRSVTFWGRPREIVGVVGDVRFRGLDRPPEPALYPPFQQVPLAFFSVLVRTAGDPAALIRPVQEALWSVDRDLAFFGVRPLDESLQASVGEPRFQMMLVTLFGALALVLAAIGVYGVIAYQVQQRTREIGVRIALGASRRRVIGGVLGEGMTLAAAGVAVGLVFAWAGLRLIAGLLFEVPAIDPATYAAVAGLLIVVALGASYVPARRAARIDPMEALRYE